MPLLVTGPPSARRAMILGMRAVATARETRPFVGEEADLVRAMAEVVGLAHSGMEAVDLADVLSPEVTWDDHALRAELVTALPDPMQRSDAAHCAMMVALMPVVPDEPGLHAARWVAQVLGADDLTVEEVEATVSAHAQLAEADLFRRFLSWKTGEQVEVVAARLARHEPAVTTPPEQVERVRRLLDTAPEGSVGQELARFYADTGFDVPGSPGTMPLAVLGSHDVHHVLAAYDASPEDEVYLAAFTAANAGTGGAEFLAFNMLQFHQGIKLGVFDPAQVALDPHALALAAERGVQTPVDLSSRTWDWHSLLHLSLDEVREQLCIPGGGSVLMGGPWDIDHHRRWSKTASMRA